jgi:ABC-2 type transport system permease protein
VLTVIFGLAYGAIGAGGPSTYSVGVVNMDTNGQYANYFLQNVSASHILQEHNYDDSTAAYSDLTQGKLQAVVVIPANFTSSCHSFLTSPSNPVAWQNTTLDIYLDRGSVFAKEAIIPMLNQALVKTLVGDQTAIGLPVQLGQGNLVSSNQTSMFDSFAPGLFAYAAIFITMTVAQSFTVNREKGLIRRVNTTPVTPAEYLGGNMLANMLFAGLQVGLVFAISYFIGYRPLGGIEGLVFAFLLMMVFSLCNIGFGLITATIAKSPGAATGIAFLFVLPQMFLGTFTGFQNYGAAKQAAAFVPSNYVTDAVTSVFARGASIAGETVVADFIIVAAFSIVVLMAGIVLFRKYGNR